MPAPLIQIQRASYAAEMFGGGMVYGWLANTTPRRESGVTTAEWLGYRWGSTPAEALAGLDVAPELATLLDHPRIWGLNRAGERWMAGYMAPWFGYANAVVEWSYGATPEAALRAAHAALEHC